jgi:flagellar FliL protein
MKKNILTVIILALCLINLILTATIVFVVVPTSQRTDQLITQVASVIELELKGDTETYDLTSAETYKLDETKQMNLASNGDGKSHLAIIDYITVYVNPKSEKYKSLNGDLTAGTYDSVILDKVESVVSSYTFDTIGENREQMKDEILAELKKVFGTSDFIVGISFGNLIYQ